MKKAGLIAIFLCLCQWLFAQNGNLVFNDTILHIIEIEIDIPHWFDTLEQDYHLNSKYPDSFPEIYRKCNIIFDGFPIPNSGFREKGNFSNVANVGKRKKPFKIAFDEFKDQKFDDLKKINLNNFTNDPSLVHEAASYKIMRESGIIAPRTSYAKLLVNKEYIGLYLIVENVDKTFLKYHFGNHNHEGNLYKTNRESGVYLNWLGTESSLYEDQGLKLNTNEAANDWTQFIHFVDVLNNYHRDDFSQKLDSIFDVQSYLKILAVEKIVRSWDSYWGGGNNFYLYEHPDGRIRWIPWDMNETFQDIKRLSQTKLLDGYLIPTNQFDSRPLLRRIFESETWKNDYLDIVCQLNNGIFSVDSLGDYLLRSHNLVKDAYFEDPNKLNTYRAFQTSLTHEYDDQVSLGRTGYAFNFTYPGIFPFINQQKDWIKDQLEGWDFGCPSSSTATYPLIFLSQSG